MYSLFQESWCRLYHPATYLNSNLYTKMRAKAFLVILCGIISLNLFGVKTVLASDTITNEEFRGGGEIIYISPASLTVVVDIMEGMHSRIVAGKIAQDAILLQNDTPCDLRSFNVGDTVQIAWKDTIYGKEVMALLSGYTPLEKNQPAQLIQSKPKTKIKTPPVIASVSPPPQKLNSSIITPSLTKRISPPSTSSVSPIIGSPQQHIIGKEETLLDIARNYNLGYNELIDMYPGYDPWLPPVGQNLLLPTERILPDGKRKGILINVPELRLYHFTRKGKSSEVTTYPIGIGDVDFETPPGKYSIGNKAVNPTWYIPPSLREKYQVTSIPPGPDNPLGKYWMGLKNTMFGIHGTDIPWSIGRTVTHGCIRMYPEDIQVFFPDIPIGESVEVVYEPVKIAKVGDDYFVEAHRDIYGKIVDFTAFAKNKAVEKGIWDLVDHSLFMATIESQRGIPVKVTTGSQAATQNRSAPAAVLPVFGNGAGTLGSR